MLTMLLLGWFSSIGWDLLCYTYTPNSKSLCPPLMKIGKAMQNVENGCGLDVAKGTQGHWQ